MRQNLDNMLKKQEISLDASTVQEAITEASGILTGYISSADQEEKLQDIRKFDRIPDRSYLERAIQHLNSVRVNIVLLLLCAFLIINALTQPVAVSMEVPCQGTVVPAIIED